MGTSFAVLRSRVLVVGVTKGIHRMIWRWARVMKFAGVRERAGCVPLRLVDGVVQVLLIESSSKPGIFVFPGGGVEKGETAAEAAVRELREEAGVSGKIVCELSPHVDKESATSTRRFAVAVDSVDVQWEENWRRRLWLSVDNVDALLSPKPLHRQAALDVAGKLQGIRSQLSSWRDDNMRE